MQRPTAILFDVNETLLDLRPLKEGIGKLLGARPEAARLWFTTLLQYSLVGTVAGKYLDFAEVGAACLRMVAGQYGQALSEMAAREAVAPLRSLPPHADVAPALGRLRDAGFRLFTLTNGSKAAVADQMTNAGLTAFFEALLSVEDVGKSKPHAEVYRWAADRVGAAVGDCLLVAAHGWDVAGAKWVGMRAAFVARPGQQPFPLGPEPDYRVASLTDLVGELT
jgi:2-haloacid dehalogenase